MRNLAVYTSIQLMLEQPILPQNHGINAVFLQVNDVTIEMPAERFKIHDASERSRES